MYFEWDFSQFESFARRLENSVVFNESMKKATRDVAKALLRAMKSYTPANEYTLINGWNGNKFLVTKNKNGFEVLIVNKTPYALAVNDGHRAFNQYGGPYAIKHRRKVRVPYRWQKGEATFYVFGHFFVERGIIRLKNTREIESIILRELQKWWDSV